MYATCNQSHVRHMKSHAHHMAVTCTQSCIPIYACLLHNIHMYVCTYATCHTCSHTCSHMPQYSCRTFNSKGVVHSVWELTIQTHEFPMERKDRDHKDTVNWFKLPQELLTSVEGRLVQEVGSKFNGKHMVCVCHRHALKHGNNTNHILPDFPMLTSSTIVQYWA